MLLKELISELQSIADKDKNRLDLEVFIYPYDDTESESPNEISGIDNSISDRIDINVKTAL